MTLHVAHVITGLTLGGAERQVEFLVRRSRHRSRVFTLYGDGPVADLLRHDGHTVRRVGSPSTTRVRTVLRLAGWLRRLSPDVVHVHLLSGQSLGIPAARLAGVPVIVSTEHSIMDGEVEGRPTTPTLQRIYRLLERASTHTVAVSETTRRRLLEWGIAPERISVIDNGIDFGTLAHRPEDGAAVRAELGIAAGELVIGAVGRLDPVKRFGPAIEAVAPLLRVRGRHFVIAGEGALRPELEALIRRLGLADAVHLMGARPDVARVLNAFDLFLSPSRDETFGMAVVEALGNGLPTSYAECPAIDDLGLTSDRVVRLPKTAGSEAEQHAIHDAVLGLLRKGIARTAPPGRLLERYDVGARVGEVDDLYERLSRASRSVPVTPRRPGLRAHAASAPRG